MSADDPTPIPAAAVEDAKKSALETFDSYYLDQNASLSGSLDAAFDVLISALPRPASPAVELVRRIRERNAGKSDRLDHDLIDWLEREPDRIAALPHLATPAGDVAGLVRKLEAWARFNPDKPIEYTSMRRDLVQTCAKAAATITTLAAEAQLFEREIDSLRDCLSKAEDEREEARRHIAAFRDNLHVSRECGVALEAERDEARRERDAYLAAYNGADKWAGQRNRDVDALTADRDAFKQETDILGKNIADLYDDINKALAERDALAERLRVVEAANIKKAREELGKAKFILALAPKIEGLGELSESMDKLVASITAAIDEWERHASAEPATGDRSDG